MSEANESEDAATGEGLAFDMPPATRDFFETVLGSLGEAVFVVHPAERRIVMTNAAAGQLFGVDASDLVGRTTRLIYRSDEDYRTLNARTEEALERGRVYRGEFDLRRADGGAFRALVTTTAIDPDDWRSGVVSVIHDVSTLREAQERATHLVAALESRVRKLRCVREAATVLTDQSQPMAVALQRVVDTIPPALGDSRRSWASISYQDVTVDSGRPDADGRSLEVHFSGLEERIGTLRVGYTQGGEGEEAELPELRTVVESLAFLIGGYCKEREHRGRTEQERDRFLQLFKGSPVAISLSDPVTGVFIEVNQKWSDLIGYARDELIGRNSVELGLWEDPAQRAELADRLRRESSLDDFRTRFRRKDGALRYAFGSLKVIELDDRPVLFSTLHDVTDQMLVEEQKARMEEQQVALERLGAISELAGGVAHDINNLLLPILVNVELALPEVSDEVRSLLEEVEEAARRGRDLTRKLLSFSGKQTLQRRPIDLAEILRSSHNIMRRLVRESISLEVRADPELPAIRADAGQMELILVNLVGNARDAIDGRGRIEVRATTGIPNGEEPAFGTADPKGLHVYLEVSDDGGGIDPDIRPRIFEPFFTTKESVSGTGLGLSSVLGIVEQHGGHILVESEPGRGTTLRLGFPALRSQAEEVDGARAPDPGDGEKPGAGHTVLVVEDDPPVRKVTARALRSYGYDVLDAEDGAAALETIRSRGEEIDLIISDMVMPGLTGLDLRDALQETHPDVPILFVSGYSWTTLEEHGVERDSVHILEKPFTPQQLEEAVQLILSESDPDR